MKAYVDSDILIWHLSGERKALDFLRGLLAKKQLTPCIGALQRAKIVFFMRPDEEARTLLLLSQFETVAVDQKIVDEAGRLYRNWNPSHGIDIADAFLAATSKLTGGMIFTLNRRRYPMSDVVVEQAWKAD